MRLIRFVILLCLYTFTTRAHERPKSQMFQDQKGFIGIVKKGTGIEIEQIDNKKRIITFKVENSEEEGSFRVSFDRFKNALGKDDNIERYFREGSSLEGGYLVLQHDLLLK